jgi:hypothetical protein
MGTEGRMGENGKEGRNALDIRTSNRIESNALLCCSHRLARRVSSHAGSRPPWKDLFILLRAEVNMTIFRLLFGRPDEAFAVRYVTVYCSLPAGWSS